MKNSISLIIFCVFFIFSCNNSNTNRTKTNVDSNLNKKSSETVKEKNINGIYYYSDDSAESTVTISGGIWRGKLVLKTGFGSSYDQSNASYSNGMVKDGVLYDESGFFELGYTDGEFLNIQISSSMVKHYK